MAKAKVNDGLVKVESAVDLMPQDHSGKKRLQDSEVKYMRDKDREPVRGIFRFFEVPGGNMSFPFLKYKGDEVETYSLNDGEIYTIPRGVARHLVNDCWYPEAEFKIDEFGRTVAHIKRKKRRCSFESLDFMDANDMRDLTPSNIEQVTFFNKL